jgi:flagellar biogenesis protein FliO
MNFSDRETVLLAAVTALVGAFGGAVGLGVIALIGVTAYSTTKFNASRSPAAKRARTLAAKKQAVDG